MGVSFLTPALLGGAALVAVPILLHLATRRKPVPHDFPALRFLRERMVANRRRLRLNHLLLLLVRMAAIALVALALARPVLRGAGRLGDREAPVAAVFVFDTAPRMDLREANRTRLEQAAALARVLLGKLPGGSRVAVLDTAGGAAAFAPSAAAVAARIDRLATATPVQSLSAAIDDGLRLFATAELPRHELYVFTDCSRGAWEDAPALDLAASHPDTAVLFVDVAATAPQDFGIEAVDLSGDRVPAGTALGITARLRRAGPAEARGVAVELLGPDGRYARRGIKPVTFREAEAVQLDLDLPGLEPGTRQGRLVIDGADDLAADDAWAFTVDVGAPARVLVAAPAPAARTGLFLTQAIAPAVLAKSGQARFEARLIDAAALAATPWDDCRGIVLVDPPPLPEATWEALAGWVGGGRGLVVWLGPRAVSAEAFNTAASRRVLGGGIVRTWRTADGGNFLAPAALDHPILAAFRRVGDAVPWQDFPVTRHWEFAAAEGEGGPDATPAAVVAAYRNGLPAVLERRLGRGTVVVITTPVSQPAGDRDAWNTLATGFEPWPFVMLANETLLHAIDVADDRNVVAGRPAVLHLDRRDVNAAFVRTPAGDDFPAAIDQKRGTITVTATQLPGNYAVRLGGGEGVVAQGFSANLDPAATDFRRLPRERLAELLGPGQRLARTEAELVRDVNLERVGSELFGWTILLVAAAVAGDWILANRFYAPREIDAAARPAAEFAAADAAPAAGAGPPPVPPAPPPVPAAVPPVPPAASQVSA